MSVGPPTELASTTGFIALQIDLMTTESRQTLVAWPKPPWLAKAASKGMEQLSPVKHRLKHEDARDRPTNTADTVPVVQLAVP